MNRVPRALLSHFGQAGVETVAMAPILLLCSLLALQGLVAGANFVVAGNAAHAGALAGQMGEDPEPAARRSAPGWSTAGVKVTERGSLVRVKLTPRAIVPGLAPMLAASGEAGYARP